MTLDEIIQRARQALIDAILAMVAGVLYALGWAGGTMAEAWRIAHTDPDAQAQVTTVLHDESDDMDDEAAMLEAATPEPKPVARQRYAGATDDPEAGRGARRVVGYIFDLPPSEDDDPEFEGMLPVPA